MNLEVKFKAVVSSKNVVRAPNGEKMYRIDLVEEQESPPQVFYSSSNSDLAKDILPLVQQVMRIMPIPLSTSLQIPRVTLWLTEDEWDKLEPKPELGDILTIVISSGDIKIFKGEN
ncbi:MAG: arcadin 1 [Candidatus Methanomethylicia archaeon]|nr:arcadin 1 [Candidatus Methanomethylicia archaeon]MDW7988538.1 arcadin 1 [Nitrososphaerota archaeon]